MSAAIGAAALTSAGLLAKRGRPFRSYSMFIYFAIMEVRKHLGCCVVFQSLKQYLQCSGLTSSALPVASPLPLAVPANRAVLSRWTV
jgi:hypothetical protein